MPFEKAKVLKAAEKFLSQGKINAAIKEYRQIIQHDADDLTALNMLGDLLARAGEKDEAVSCFSRIAEHYREQEFRLKAIAMYKKIEKLKPRDPETATRLADLYTAQGLIVDARAQYLVIADAYSKAGKSKQTLQVLHKIADLDPQNTDVRLKLADGYRKEDMQLEAARAYAEAANRLLEKGQFEESLEAYTKAFELRPHDKFVLKGLVSVHAALGTAEDAAELIEKAVAEEPEDTELISMLAHAYIEAGDASGAERATAQLMTHDASNYRRYIEVARAYLSAGQESEGARVLESIIEPMLAGREENDLLELVNELLERDPEQVASLRLLARIHWWQRDMEKLRSTLERLVESAEASDLPEDERYALTQLVRLAPDERRFAERLEALGGSLEEFAEGTQIIDDMSSTEAPVYESFALVEEETVDVPAVALEEEAAPEFEWNSVAGEGVPDANASFADLNEPDLETGFELGLASEVTVLSDQLAADSSAQEFVFENADLDTAEQTGTTASDDPAKVQSMQQELESVDFYISQGYADIAEDTLELLERQFGSHPDIDSRREKLNQSGKVAQQAQPGDKGSEAGSELFVGNSVAEFEVDPGVEVTFAEEEPASAAVTPAPSHAGIDSGLAEIFEEFRIEAEGEHASSNEDYETHYNMATAYKEMDLLDEAIREFQTAAGLTKASDGTARYFQCCNMLGHCFVQKGMPRAAVLWFKKGLDSPGRAPEEYKALQYELGSAYEQMGDLQRAIGVFTEVYGLDVGYRDIGERLHELQERQASQKKKKGKQKA